MVPLNQEDVANVLQAEIEAEIHAHQLDMGAARKVFRIVARMQT